MRPANDNGGANVVSRNFRRMVQGYMHPRTGHATPTNDRFGDAARVDIMYDEWLKDADRYVEVAGKRHDIASLQLILNRNASPAMRTVYMLGDKGENIHQFELTDAAITHAVHAYNLAPDAYTRRSIAVGMGEAICSAASVAGVKISHAYAESMFRCCAGQLASPPPRSRAR